MLLIINFKLGWTPSYFKSSRYLKADKLKQRPEDFMDTEVGLLNFSVVLLIQYFFFQDLNQFGIAHRTVQATKDFRSTSDDKVQKSSSWNTNNLVIPGLAPLEDLIKPVT